MAAVGRARLKTESLINSQKSRALYGEAGEKDIIFRSQNIKVHSIVFGQCCGCRECFVSFPRRASRVNLSGNSRVFKGFSERPKAARFRLLIPIFRLQPSARSALHHLLGRELSLGETNPMIFQSKVKKASTKAQ